LILSLEYHFRAISSHFLNFVTYKLMKNNHTEVWNSFEFINCVLLILYDVALCDQFVILKFSESIIAFQSPFLAKPHPCLYILLMSLLKA